MVPVEGGGGIKMIEIHNICIPLHISFLDGQKLLMVSTSDPLMFCSHVSLKMRCVVNAHSHRSLTCYPFMFIFLLLPQS